MSQLNRDRAVAQSSRRSSYHGRPSLVSRAVLKKIDRTKIVEAVETIIINSLGSGRCCIATVADSLFMSERTLQYKLKVEDRTFRQILDRVRRVVVMQYMLDSSLSLKEIAVLVGFREYSVFSKTFRRWTCYSPSEYRNNNLERI